MTPTPSEGLWLFQDLLANSTASQVLDLSKLSESLEKAALTDQLDSTQSEQETISQQKTTQSVGGGGAAAAGYDTFSIAGIRPSNIASLLNTVSETGFSYFNVHDQCRSRTACDVGYMLYKKLNFVHNWIIRASVRTLVDSSNLYALSWTNGMMGKNCTLIYPQCHQSPLDSLMNFALLTGM